MIKNSINNAMINPNAKFWHLIVGNSLQAEQQPSLNWLGSGLLTSLPISSNITANKVERLVPDNRFVPFHTAYSPWGRTHSSCSYPSLEGSPMDTFMVHRTGPTLPALPLLWRFPVDSPFIVGKSLVNHLPSSLADTN